MKGRRVESGHEERTFRKEKLKLHFIREIMSKKIPVKLPVLQKSSTSA